MNPTFQQQLLAVEIILLLMKGYGRMRCLINIRKNCEIEVRKRINQVLLSDNEQNTFSRFLLTITVKAGSKI